MILKHLEKHGIGYTQEGRHGRDGWIQLLECPFCSSQGTHLGIHTGSGAANCYKCGGKSWFNICKELDIPYLPLKGSHVPLVRDTEKVRRKAVKRPSGVLEEILPSHWAYLTSRGLDAGTMSLFYNLSSTDHYHPKMGNRIFIPIHDEEGIEISWQLRAVVEDKAKYLTCPDELASAPVKDYLFAEHLLGSKRNVILCEGVFDVFAFPIGVAVACLGKVLSDKQIWRLAQYENVYVCLDSDADPRGIMKQLAPFTNVYKVTLETGDDPSDATKQEIAEIVEQVRS